MGNALNQDDSDVILGLGTLSKALSQPRSPSALGKELLCPQGQVLKLLRALCTVSCSGRDPGKQPEVLLPWLWTSPVLGWIKAAFH